MIRVSGLDIAGDGDRVLFRQLTMRLGKEKVALVGRNGAGKSTLLSVLAGHTQPTSGQVHLDADPVWVPQCVVPQCVVLQSVGDANELESLLHAVRSRWGASAAIDLAPLCLEPLLDVGREAKYSLGELRKLHLARVHLLSPSLVLLDEPSQDLDEAGVRWLVDWLRRFEGALVLASHDRRLLGCLRHFMVVAESGCSLVEGDLQELDASLLRREQQAQRRYLRRLNTLVQQEARSEKYRLRRLRKKRVGRVRELQRMTPRSRLNQKRSAAQEKQGRIEGTRARRLEVSRAWVRSARRAMEVSLPLESVFQPLGPPPRSPIVSLKHIDLQGTDHTLLKDFSLTVARERIGVVGPNGAGKTSLLRLMLGELKPAQGGSQRQRSRMGAIAQAGQDWKLGESLLEYLVRMSDLDSEDAAAALLVAHRFPFALASRPMDSLSPGERVRAALICLLQRSPPVDVLILDEPTHSLDFLGESALRRVLTGWKGGLVVASHNRDFLESLGLDAVVSLDGEGAWTVAPAQANFRPDTR